MDPSPPPHISLVSKARTALHTAAAKAEKALTEIKTDRKGDRESEGGQSSRGSKMLAEHESDHLDGPSSKIKEEFSNGISQAEENCSLIYNGQIVPSSCKIRQLATAAESGVNFKSMKEIIISRKESLSSKEKTSLSLSVVKSLVLRDKDEKSSSDFCDEDIHLVLHSLFNSDENNSQGNGGSCRRIPVTYLSKGIFGAPPESFVVRLSETIGGLKSLQKMALCWHYVVGELRRLWTDGRPIPHMPLEADPDLNCCLLHQQLQAINCCIARKRRRIIASKSLDSVLKNGNLQVIWNACSQANGMSYAKVNSGDYVLRLGADCPSDNLTMLETGEPIYSPVTQEGPVLTEELIKETEELVLRTRSVGAGCSQLLSDMQAFKAANPGCVLEDFIRWHSPPDWRVGVDDGENSSTNTEDVSIRKGKLSRRMEEEGNLWRELWKTAKPVPAVRQTPLFDEDLAVENILQNMEDISPAELFEQLFISLLFVGYLVAEAAFPPHSSLFKLFTECKDYVVTIYQSGNLSSRRTDICKAYDTLEAIVMHPEDAIMVTEEATMVSAATGEPKQRFKKFRLNFINNKDKQHQSHANTATDQKKSEEKRSGGGVFSHLLDKRSLFSRRQHNQDADHRLIFGTGLVENDWTLV